MIDVTIALYDSAASDIGRRELTNSGFTLPLSSLGWEEAPFLFFAPSSGITPSDGSGDATTACSSVMIFSFTFAKPNASITPPKKPHRSETARFRGMFGSVGSLGGLAGSTIQMLLDFKLDEMLTSFCFC